MGDELHIDIDYVANLARLSLSDEEKQRYGKQLEHVLDYFTQLREVDVDGLEPTAHAFPLVNVWREDEARGTLSNEDALRNAPASRDNQVLVPKVVEDA